MGRLIDDLLDPKTLIQPAFWNTDFVSDEWVKAEDKVLKESLSKAQVFVIDNVAEYFWAGTDQEYWHPQHDFPCIAPPFDTFWMEYRKPSKIVSDCKDTTNINENMMNMFPPRNGVLFNTFSIDDVMEFSKGVVGTKLIWSKQERIVPPEILKAKWFLNGTLFMEWQKGAIMGPVLMAGFWLDDGGNVIDFIYHNVVVGAKDRMHPAMTWGSDNFTLPPLLALSFLNCKNVTLENNPPPPKLNKKYVRNHGRSLSSYKTLIINPVAKVARERSGSGVVGIQKALRICRGHFMHSGIAPKPGAPDDRGRVRGKLFGKLIGRYWVDQRLRTADEKRTYKMTTPIETVNK